MRDLPVPVAGAGGLGGGKGGGGSSQRSPQESPDSLRSTQYARVMNLICEGEIEGIVGGAQGIYIEDTPLQNPDGSWNFTGAAVEWRNGLPWQAPIPGFSSVETESSVGVTVRQLAPVTRTVINPNIDAVRVTVGFATLSSTDTGTGDVRGASVDVWIEVQVNGGGFHRMILDTVEGKTTSRYQRSYLINLSARWGAGPNQYDIRVGRGTNDSTTVYLVDAFQWETMTEIVNSNLIYPHSAICGVQVDAGSFRSIPKLAFDVKMRRIQVPTNYNPVTREYYGVWDGTFQIAWTDNPAWVLYDLVTDERGGLGNWIPAHLCDKWNLYTIARYCDEMVPDGLGGVEPRYTCNVYIQTREDAISLLQQFAAIFNGLIMWNAGAMTFMADMPGNPLYAYTPANVVDGRFTYRGTPLNQRSTVALVTWCNPANQYQQEIEYVEDQDAVRRWGIRETSVNALGCTSRGQAHRVGRWILLTEQWLGETVVFSTGLQGAFVRPGHHFLTTDPVRAGNRAGGRITAAAANWVQLDAPYEFRPGLAYGLSVMLPDGTVQSSSIITPMGTSDSVTITEVFRQTPQRNAVWAISAGDALNETWRCISCAEDEDGNVELQGVAYRTDKFAAIEHGLQLAPLPTGIMNPFFVGPCTELRVTESLFQISPVVVGARATFSWLAPLGATRFVVNWTAPGDAPAWAESFMSSVDIEPTRTGMWSFSVQAINSLGRVSTWATITVEIVALNRPPEDVREFQLDVLDDSANLRWRAAENLDVIVGGLVVIRYSNRMSTAVTWEEAREIARFAGAQSNGFAPLMKGAYLAKFVNSSGRYSNNSAYVISTTGPLRDFNVVAVMDQHPGFAGERVNTVVRYGVLHIEQGEDDFAVSTEAGYYFAPVPALDMGRVYTCRVTTTLEGSVYSLFDSVDTWPDWDARLDVDGVKVEEGGGQVVVRITNVNPATATAEDWSPWTRLVVADLTFRAAEFALVLHTQDTTWGIGITELSASVDVPDRMESQNNVPIPAGVTVINFTVPFKSTPAISIIAQGLETGDWWTVFAQSTHGFAIVFQNAAGAFIPRTCDWIARGYGYEHADLAGLGYAKLTGQATPALVAQRAAIGGYTAE
ncbi:host specificity protein J [Paraburkholderia sp. MM5384-R2]|uniref:host specificity protein J n=1 Tax=Paraburkholderia sp. MM5384-R2 TaxID=2723097 RepID=UPI0016185DC2|nr:phage tail protein [Paraburkholderia sp. MM5384-R2]MBB5496886.1 putative phage tail protein [Paraburkholderia sp. MM5384-R2]